MARVWVFTGTGTGTAKSTHRLPVQNTNHSIQDLRTPGKDEPCPNKPHIAPNRVTLTIHKWSVPAGTDLTHCSAWLRGPHLLDHSCAPNGTSTMHQQQPSPVGYCKPILIMSKTAGSLLHCWLPPCQHKHTLDHWTSCGQRPTSLLVYFISPIHAAKYA
jgi:hypothetical protein